MSKINLRVTLVQCDIKPLDVETNLVIVEQEVHKAAGYSDLIVFPEALFSGFSPEALDHADEWGKGRIYQRLCSLSKTYQVGLAGSYFVRDKDSYFNRFFLIDGESVSYQDKRHLFALGGESDMVIPTRQRKILDFRGWKIMPLVCYDLRFPVWTRVRNNDYDLIICVANWPKGRREVWRTLLKARSMENLAYVVGVNRVGVDQLGINYVGDSVVYNPRGEAMAQIEGAFQNSCSCLLDYTSLLDLRTKFPVWQDADNFELR